MPAPDLRGWISETFWEILDEERPMLVPYRGLSDGFQAIAVSVFKTCLAPFLLDWFDNDCAIVETRNESWRFKNRA